MSCENLATKGELDSLRNQLNSQISALNNIKANQSDLNNLKVTQASLGGVWNQDNKALELALGALVVAFSAIKPIVFWVRDQVISLTQKVQDLADDFADSIKDFKNLASDVNKLKKEYNETKTLALYLEIEMNKLKEKTNEAINRTNALLNSVNQVVQKANHADERAAAAMAQANEVLKVANAALSQATTATNQFNTAINQTNNIKSQIESINQAIQQVNEQIEIIKSKQLIQDVKNVDISFELDGLRLKTLNLTGQVEQLKTQIATTATTAQVDTKISENNKVIGAGAGAITSISTSIKNLEKDSTETKNRVGALESGLTAIQSKTNTLEQTQSKQQAEINEGNVINTQQLGAIQAAIGGLGLTVGAIALQTSPTKIAEAAETGICNSTKPGGCMKGALDPIKKNVDDVLTQVGPAGALGIQGAQTLNNTIGILNLLNTVYSYLQTFYNYTKGKFDKLWDFLGIDRFLNLVNFAIGLHNAGMLSKNLTGTLIETTNNIFTALRIKDPEGNEVNIGPIIGGTIDSWMKNLLGPTVWANTKETWLRANRIVSAAARLKDATYAFSNSVAEMGETLGENISQMSNALVDEGLVSPDILDYKDPKPKFRQHFGRTQTFLSN